MDVTVYLIFFTDMLMHNVQCLAARTNEHVKQSTHNRHETHQHIHNRQSDHTIQFMLWNTHFPCLFKGVECQDKTCNITCERNGTQCDINPHALLGKWNSDQTIHSVGEFCQITFHRNRLLLG